MTNSLLKLFTLLAIFASVFLVAQQVSGFAMKRSTSKREVNKRLQMLRIGVKRESLLGLLRSQRGPSSGYGLFGGVIDRFYNNAAIADLPILPSKLISLSAITTCVVELLLLVFAVSRGWNLGLGTVLMTGAASLAIGFGLPLMYVNRRAQKRRRKMEEQFPIALDVFTRALRAGHPVSAAIDLITQEMTDPIGTEFGLVADEIAYGSDLNTALAGLGNRWNLEDIKMFAVCVSVQSETGGNLAEVLINLSKVIRDRAGLFLKVRALSSEGRMSAWMLSVMPMLTFIGLFLINPGFYLNVAQDPIFTSGFIILMLLYAVGVFWIRRMVDLKV